jgi:hypothetical protein
MTLDNIERRFGFGVVTAKNLARLRRNRRREEKPQRAQRSQSKKIFGFGKFAAKSAKGKEKFEYRNPKQIQRLKKAMFQIESFGFGVLDFQRLRFISLRVCFGFRALKFGFCSVEHRR